MFIIFSPVGFKGESITGHISIFPGGFRKMDFAKGHVGCWLSGLGPTFDSK